MVHFGEKNFGEAKCNKHVNQRRLIGWQGRAGIIGDEAGPLA
jgi:hypothetical protein